MSLFNSGRLLYPLFMLMGAVAFFFYTEYISIKPASACHGSTYTHPLTHNTSYTIHVCDVVVMVLSGSPYHNTRIRDIQDTYMRQSCQSDTRKNIVFVSDVQDDTIPTIGVPCGNGYDGSMCCKVINGWRAAYKLYPNAKYYIQVDDDSYLHMERLTKYLSTFNHNDVVYAGHPLYITLSPEDGKMVNTGRDYRWGEKDLIYAAGWFGVISRRALQRIFDNQLDENFFALCRDYFWPDVVVGIVLRAAGVFFNTETSGYHTGWNEGGAPLDDRNKDLITKTVGTHCQHDTKRMFEFEKLYGIPPLGAATTTTTTTTDITDSSAT